MYRDFFSSTSCGLYVILWDIGRKLGLVGEGQLFLLVVYDKLHLDHPEAARYFDDFCHATFDLEEYLRSPKAGTRTMRENDPRFRQLIAAKVSSREQLFVYLKDYHGVFVEVY